jgi:hypothetical protein
MRTKKQTDKWYLAGPMTGIPQDNLPAFIAATVALRGEGYTVTTPVEFETAEVMHAVVNNPEMTFNEAAGTTWGSALARDVEIIADDIDGIVFLPGWAKSKGARLEAFVGILTDKKFGRYVPETGQIELMSPQTVLTQLTRTTYEGLVAEGKA